MSNIDNLFELLNLLKAINIKRSEVRKRVSKGLKSLLRRNIINLKEEKIMNLRFVDEFTLEEIGKEFGVTRERIREIEAKTLEKIRIYNSKQNDK